jgi:RNA polymerase sigma factor (sigma-70 family)
MPAFQSSYESRAVAVESSRAGTLPDAAVPLPGDDVSHDGSARVESLLLLWQSTGVHDHLERLITAILPLATQMARKTLFRLGYRDSSMVEDAIALVFDHLRRLPGPANGERPVARFIPRTNPRCTCSLTDPGQAYILWLARERAADMARANRRRRRDTAVFSELDASAIGSERGYVGHHAVDGAAGAAAADLCRKLHDALPHLPPREQLVIKLLLEGKNQAVIAHAMDCCVGTVSRLRTRAIAQLRALLAE